MLALSKLKICADETFIVAQMKQFFFGKIGHIVGDGKKTEQFVGIQTVSKCWYTDSEQMLVYRL